MTQRNKTNQLDSSPYYRLWARQLLAEFEDITHQHGLGLEAPIIEITETEKQYGSWQAATRTIRLSARLITTHSWNITCQILKHEMAHQICSELFHVQTCDHGSAFHRACDLLGLPAAFRHAAADLPESAATAPANNQQTEKGRQFIARIGKLLALATSANEHEAALAMEKASQLMARYNLRQIKEDSHSAFTTLIINTRCQRLEGWQRKICVILLRFFHVKVVTSSLYDPMGDTQHKTIELFGRQENVTIAEYCYTFLAAKIESLWRQNRGRISGKGLRARNSYYLGLLQGFYDKLNSRETSAPTAPPTDDKATDKTAAGLSLLIRTEEEALDRFVAMRFPHLRKRSGGRTMIYRETYEQGRTDGGRIVLHKGVTDHNHEQGLLIEEKQ
jgi:hypothetical protein